MLEVGVVLPARNVPAQHREVWGSQLPACVYPATLRWNSISSPDWIENPKDFHRLGLESSNAMSLT